MNERQTQAGLRIKSAYMRDRHLWRLIIIMLLWFIFMAVTRFSKFYTVVNFQTMFAQFPEFGLMSLGVMVCMITGGIDLSTVGIANVTAISTALLMQHIGGDSRHISVFWVVVVFLLAIVVGMIAGGVNGMLVAKLHIPPILATLGMGELFTGIGIVLTNGSAISDFPTTYAFAVNNRVLGIPVQFLIFAAAAVILSFMLIKTTYGKKLILLGSSQNVAKFSGLKVDMILIKTYLISGVCSALGGMIMLANYNSARADYGSNYTLQCILIVVLGGVSPNGGKGKISGVLLAIFLVRALETGLNRFPQISSYYVSLIWGAVLLLVMVLNYFTENDINLFKKKPNNFHAD